MMKRHILSLLLAGAMVLSLTACSSKTTEEEEAPAAAGVAVQVQTISRNDISTENKVSGKITADNESMIMIATAAKCTAVYVEAGSEVKAGDKICTLDLGSTLSTYNAARISYNSTVQSYNDQKAILDQQVQLAEKNVSNTEALLAIGAASQLELDQAKLNYSSAVAGRNSALAQLEAGIQNAKSGIQQLDMTLENVDANGNVVAPIDGTLVSLNATEDAFISNAMPVAVIDGVDQMKVVVSVSEALVPKLKAGDSADVSVSAANKTFSAVIRSVEQAANIQTKLYTVTLTVPADVTDLMNGMFADVTFHTDTSSNTVVIPTESIQTSGSTQYVYVVENNTARYVEITTGLTGSGVTEVTSGLSGGEQVVTVGQFYLKDGSAVRIVSGEG